MCVRGCLCGDRGQGRQAVGGIDKYGGHVDGCHVYVCERECGLLL